MTKQSIAKPVASSKKQPKKTTEKAQDKKTVKQPITPPTTATARLASKPTSKRRLVVSQKNLPPHIQEVMKERYPRGYADYMELIIKVDKPDGSFFYAITLEVEDAIYLVKIDVNIDTDYEEVEKNLFGNSNEVDEEGNELPDTEDDSKDFADDDIVDGDE